jgi:hypothetical protein
VGERGTTRRKFRVDGAAALTVVVTAKEIDPPAATLPAENVHVETGGHPAIEKVT